MDQALAWIGWIAEWIGKFFPRWIILDVTEAGVKYVRGSNVKRLGPGIHFWWPVVTPAPQTYPIKFQADDLRSQTFMTADTDHEMTVVVGGMITYEVVDIMKLLPEVFRASQTVKVMALGCIHRVCCRMTWTELREAQRKGTLDTKLRNAAKEALEPFGVRVIDVQLTDLARSRVLKIMQSISKDEE